MEVRLGAYRGLTETTERSSANSSHTEATVPEKEPKGGPRCLPYNHHRGIIIVGRHGRRSQTPQRLTTRTWRRGGTAEEPCLVVVDATAPEACHIIIYDDVVVVVVEHSMRIYAPWVVGLRTLYRVVNESVNRRSPPPPSQTRFMFYIIYTYLKRTHWNVPRFQLRYSCVLLLKFPKRNRKRIFKRHNHVGPPTAFIDNAPCDFFSPNLKSELKGTRFDNVEAMKAKATEVLNKLTEADF
ncbi:HTH 48 domain-containing protein [Aphis craccivora]|uniref:HTH 48 domain-containing protein n=1 Tax=Aphis craccivora TaxID=307492 RepID=A0A6G0ZBP6_APHCR|nr:HTH 48 domain-containing protein [Aphis craccivora]